jgi:hypothetical protein
MNISSKKHGKYLLPESINMNPEEQYDTSMKGKAMKSKYTLKKTVYPAKYLGGGGGGCKLNRGLLV